MQNGSCNCGGVRIAVTGDPVRPGICHCLTCRKETGSAFMAFAVYMDDQVTATGQTSSWRATTDHRHFCPGCGSHMFARTDGSDEVELRIGCLDAAPTGLAPTYELWIGRREHWLPALPGTRQFDRKRQ